MTTNPPITIENLRRWFGEDYGMELATVIIQAPPEVTVRDLHEIIRVMAHTRGRLWRGLPKGHGQA